MLPIEKISSGYGSSMAIVIQACRVYLKTATPRSLDILIEKQSTNWKKVLLLSRMHRIRPIVFRTLMNSAAPFAIKEQLKKELQVNALLNFSIAKETRRLIKLLGLANIKALPYKGVAYSKQFYGDIAMRESSDIDLVISADVLSRTFEIFEKEGYHAPNKKLYKKIGHLQYIAQEKDLCFDKKYPGEYPLHVELHFKVTHPLYRAPFHINQFNINPFDLSKTITCEANKADERYLQQTEHFRAVILHHMVQDGLEYLKLFIDLAVAIQKLSEPQGHYQNKDTKQSTPPQGSISCITQTLDSVYHTNIAFSALNKLLGVGAKLVKNMTSEDERLSVYFTDYNLRSAQGRYKRYRLFGLIGHYRRTIYNRSILIRSSKQRRLYQQNFWINLCIPQPADKEAISLPHFLYPLYFLVRAIRVLYRCFCPPQKRPRRQTANNRKLLNKCGLIV